MKINWIISKDNKKALLNNGDLEVLIKEIDLEKEEPVKQRISKKFETRCGFIKIKSGRAYDCIIVQNKLYKILDALDIEAASKIIPKIFSSLGDTYEEK